MISESPTILTPNSLDSRSLAEIDPIEQVIADEKSAQCTHIELIASENLLFLRLSR